MRPPGEPAWLNWSFAFKATVRDMLDTSIKRNAQPEQSGRVSRRAELLVFAIIAAFIWPVAAVGVVGGYGFLVWMTQLILGPPGPPGH
jgi:nitrate reductase NapE